MRRTDLTTLLATLGLSLALFGCGENAHDADEHGDDGGAAHHENGPHGGHVIDLGRSHKYHAELMDDDESGTLTVYILDGDLKEVAIDAAEIIATLDIGGETRTFTLTGQGDAEKHSTFALTDKSLVEGMHKKDAAGKLRVTIDGTPYTGDLGHHDH